MQVEFINTKTGYLFQELSKDSEISSWMLTLKCKRRKNWRRILSKKELEIEDLENSQSVS